MLSKVIEHWPRWTGHLWTIAPTVRHRILPAQAPTSTNWSTTIDEPGVGEVTIRGKYCAVPGADTLVVVVHGLGGHPESAYVVPTAIAVRKAGYSSLRLALRGSEGVGGDFYHAGLTDDLHIALADPRFASYERIFVIGYSLGGHITLRATTEEQLDPRVAAVAAVCSPVDLGAGAAAIDSPAAYIYRKYILLELMRMYGAIAETAEVPTPVERIARVRTIREWDALTVVPRFGFDSVDDYYETAGIAGSVDRIARPALLVASRHDPMIPAATIDPVLEHASDLLEPRFVEGAGHVFFPPTLDLGYGPSPGLVPQILHWLEQA